MSHFKLDSQITLGRVHMTVKNLHRSLEFYQGILGMRTEQKDAHRVTLYAGQTPLFELVEDATAQPRPLRATGLYHAAIVMPSRVDLARTLVRLIETRYKLQGASDHLVSEALYLADPDDNGLEIYADRPRELWPRAGSEVRMRTDPLDVEGLLATMAQNRHAWTGLAEGTRIGHVHLQVNNIQKANDFYIDTLGFDLMQRLGSSASFLSVGGYHHHLGLNTWSSFGGTPPPPNSIGLRHYSILLSNESERERLIKHLQTANIAVEQRVDGFFLRDPAGNGIVIF